MIAYLLKTVLCSALLYGYYHMALRNKVFHQWNRFYLLAIVPLSLLLPLVRIRLEAAAEAVSDAPLRLLEVVSDGNERIEAVNLGNSTAFDWSPVFYGAYTFVALLLLLHFSRGLLRLRTLSKRYPMHSADGVELVLAPVAGTPFSFFGRIFWNPALDLASDNGRQILQHELVHVREGHSFDKLLLQAALALCWFNPVFWLLRNELHLVHEFIADERSVRNQDAGALARLILQAAYPEQYSRLTNPFFHHAIKRRIHMLNQLKQNTRVRYLGRVLALPLLAGIGLAFAVRTAKAQTPASDQNNGSKFTVVIDPGHGRMENGAWNGASFAGVSEDEITLAIALKVSELNADPNLKIIQTRGDEKIVPVKVRPVVAQGADLFLSLHVNASAEDGGGIKPTTKWSGFSVLLSRDSVRFNQSRLLGSAILDALSGIYTTDAKLQSRKQGVWVIDQAPCPAALLELGYINNEKDRAFIQLPANQERIAKEILNAITRYRLRMAGTALSPTPALKDKPDVGISADDTGTLRQKIAFIEARLTALRKELKNAGERKTTPELIRFLEGKKKELQTQLRDEAAGNPIKRLDVQPDGTVIAVHADGTRERLSQKAAESRHGINISGDQITIDTQKGTAEAASIDPATDPVLQALTGPAPTLTLEELQQMPVTKLLCPEGYELISAVYSTDLNTKDILEIPVKEGTIHPGIAESFPNVLRGGTIIVDKRVIRTKSGELKRLPALAYHIK